MTANQTCIYISTLQVDRYPLAQYIHV